MLQLSSFVLLATEENKQKKLISFFFETTMSFRFYIFIHPNISGPWHQHGTYWLMFSLWSPCSMASLFLKDYSLPISLQSLTKEDDFSYFSSKVYTHLDWTGHYMFHIISSILTLFLEHSRPFPTGHHLLILAGRYSVPLPSLIIKGVPSAGLRTNPCGNPAQFILPVSQLLSKQGFPKQVFTHHLIISFPDHFFSTLMRELCATVSKGLITSR